MISPPFVFHHSIRCYLIVVVSTLAKTFQQKTLHRIDKVPSKLSSIVITLGEYRMRFEKMDCVGLMIR